MPAAKYIVNGVNLYAIRNRNEARVAQCLQEILAAGACGEFSDKDLQDVYAYALNLLPARYCQSGTIILRDPVRKDDIRDAVEDAIDVVRHNPKA